MIDIKRIRETPAIFKQAAIDKCFNVDIDALLDFDAQLRVAKQTLQDTKTAQNAAGKQIAQLDGEEKAAAIATMADLKKTAAATQTAIDELQPQFDALMMLVPAPAAAEVPLGKDDTENAEMRTVGEIPTFDFEPKDHVELGETLDIIDIPRGVKIAGSRNYILKGAGAMLHQAVLRLASDLLIQRGYELLTVPVLVKEEVMRGTGYFPLGRDQAYLAERDNKALVGTAEVPVTAYYSGETLAEADLPKKFVAMSTCFRREAGAAGKDTHGLYRIHSFDKVEQVVLCKNCEETSKQFHAEILQNSEDVMAALELPYRVVNVCTGDLGQGQIQKFDIETWMPSRKSYGETHSASRFYDFQTRRLNIRYKDADGKMHFAHSLNNTVAASPRILIPIIEMNQNADGSVNVPAALQPYMNGITKIEAK
ncbi:MAG: serine--tRNA ligase [Phycisphaerales bacterium]|jgi:seryl-tRNA synthetase|nr:serine--tRNA ligase [Phycisphaerales bacterium]MBT7171712.1 serine--tRNA ligase [Phycisphaerales bacterium]